MDPYEDPPCRERVGLSPSLRAVGAHFSLRDRLNVPSGPNRQRGYICDSVQLYRFHASGTQLCGYDAPPPRGFRDSLLVPVRQVFAGLPFVFSTAKV